MMTVIKCTVKNRNRQFARRSKREVLFCELSDTKNVECVTKDNYSCDYISFEVLNFTIQISNEKLAVALYKLSNKGENILLIVLTVFMIYYIEKQVEYSCIIKFVGHVVKKQKKVSFANYLITNCITSILAVIAIIGYFVYMLYSTKMMGITYNDNLLIFMISSSLFGARAVFYHHIYMIF